MEPSATARLVQRAREGDRDAFGELHAGYASMVHAVLMSRVDPAAAEDLTQEVFLTALSRLSSLQKPERFGAWLASIARNRATDHHRRKRRFIPLPPDLGRPPRPATAANQILDAVHALPPAYGEILLMRLMEGMTGPEIARQTGMTPGSVRVNLSRGMAKLREKLGVQRSTATGGVR